jgi:hypothetical protein
VVLPGDVSTGQHASLALAYTSACALLATLSIGPLNDVLGRRNPADGSVRLWSLRRDSFGVGVWTGLAAALLLLVLAAAIAVVAALQAGGVRSTVIARRPT